MGHLHALDHLIEFCRPFDDGVLADHHAPPGAGRIL
jgi:hypothetical protein